MSVLLNLKTAMDILSIEATCYIEISPDKQNQRTPIKNKQLTTARKRKPTPGKGCTNCNLKRDIEKGVIPGQARKGAKRVNKGSHLRVNMKGSEG